MLVLTRKANQQIQIGENVVITILQVKGNSVRVGIEAPRDVRVIRGELRGLEPKYVEVELNCPAPESVVTNEMAAAGGLVRMDRSTSPARGDLRQTPGSNEERRDLRHVSVLPGMAASAVVDFTPMRPLQRLGNSPLRGMIAARR